MANAVSLNIIHSCRHRILHFHSVEEAGVAHLAFLGVEAVFAHVAALDDRHDRKVEFLGKRIVTAVMGRDCHNGACAITGEHVF